MKSSQKIQFVLTPIFICILSIMLVVVSFSWYKVSASTNIQTESSEVSIKAEAPEGVEVTITLTPICDDYQVSTIDSKNVYSLTMQTSEFGKLNGYYGQTGLKTYPDLDKVYIAFYKAVISSNENIIDINSAYISNSVVTRDKDGMDKINETINPSPTNESTSPYQVRFYDGYSSVDETTNSTTYTFSNESVTFDSTNATLNNESKKYELTTYVGVKFIASVTSSETNYATLTDEGAFLYSDIKYFGSTFTLTACFVNIPTN